MMIVILILIRMTAIMILIATMAIMIWFERENSQKHRRASHQPQSGLECNGLSAFEDLFCFVFVEPYFILLHISYITCIS